MRLLTVPDRLEQVPEDVDEHKFPSNILSRVLVKVAARETEYYVDTYCKSNWDAVQVDEGC